MTNYSLSQTLNSDEKYFDRLVSSGSAFVQFLREDKLRLIAVFFLILINSAAGVITPYLIAQAVDTYISSKNLSGLQNIVFILLGIYIVTVITGFLQSRIMGQISQNTLVRLRTTLFSKIQELPISFFNQNKSGDLISRINNDTDKLNTFLSESVIRFAGSFFVILGIGIFIFVLNPKLAAVSMIAAVALFFITRIVSPFIESTNKNSLQATSNLSGEIQESLTNFKVIVAFDRRDYFQEKFATFNNSNFKTAFKAAVLNDVFRPLYDFAGYIAQILVLLYGIYLINQGELSIGLLIGFLAYTQRFYDPLRILGSIWGSIQISLAAWDRVRKILHLESDLKIIPHQEKQSPQSEKN